MCLINIRIKHLQSTKQKKIQLNQTVKQTLQQMQTLLPGLKLRSSPMSQKQTSQFFFPSFSK